MLALPHILAYLKLEIWKFQFEILRGSARYEREADSLLGIGPGSAETRVELRGAAGVGAECRDRGAEPDQARLDPGLMAARNGGIGEM
jgi:hypothetical protein